MDAARSSESSSPDAFYDAEMASLDNFNVHDTATANDPEQDLRDSVTSPTPPAAAPTASQLVSFQDLGQHINPSTSTELINSTQHISQLNHKQLTSIQPGQSLHTSTTSTDTPPAHPPQARPMQHGTTEVQQALLQVETMNISNSDESETRGRSTAASGNGGLNDVQNGVQAAGNDGSTTQVPAGEATPDTEDYSSTVQRGSRGSLPGSTAAVEGVDQGAEDIDQFGATTRSSGLESSAQPAGTLREDAPGESSQNQDGQVSDVAVAETSHGQEDDSWESWQQHKRHFFILNSAGKPVFSRYGDENMLAGFMAIIQAIISVVQDQGDNLRHIQAGKHLIVVLVKGPLYLVAVSCVGEPVAALNKQLVLLYNQVIFIVTSSIERVIVRNPGYDVRGLLGGTCTVLSTLLKSFSLDPTYLLEANQALPLPVPERKAVCDALHEAVKNSGSMYGILLAEGLLVAVERLKHPALHPLDLLLLINFVRSNDATYRYRFGESFSPLCLPHFQASAFLHAYIRYLHPDAGICLVLLSASSDSFYRLSEQRQHMEQVLGSSGLLHSLVTRVTSPGGGQLQLEQLPRAAGGGTVGTTPLWHFMMKIPGKRQVITPALRDPLADRQVLKRAVRAYARQHATVWDPNLIGVKPHRLYWHMDNNWAMLASIDREYELYVVLDPLVTKEEAARISDQLRRYFLDKQRSQEFVLPQ